MSELRVETQAEFDAAPFSGATAIRLGSGVFTALNPWIIPNGCRSVRGTGDTLIESDVARTSGIFMVGNDCHEDGGITISDLTIDGKFATIGPNIPRANRKLDGLALFGNHNIAERIQVRGCGGTAGDLESYGIILLPRIDDSNGHREIPTIGSKVRDCIVWGDEGGSYDNGIGSAVSLDALIEGCTVHNMRSKDGIYGGVGFQCNDAVTLKNNTTHGCFRGFYSEHSNGAILDGNRFLDCLRQGIFMLIGSKYATIVNNIFATNADAIAIQMDEPDGIPVTGTKIIGNTFRGSGQGILLAKQTGRGQLVTHNTLPPAMVSQLAPDAVCSGNRTLTGGLIASLPDNPAVMPEKIPKHWKAKLIKI